MPRVLASYPEEFLEYVEGKTFHNPETGNRVVFQSLPPDEQKLHYGRWKKIKGDSPHGAKLRKNKDGVLFVDDSPYAELMSKYLSSPSKEYPRETRHWNSVRDWAVHEKPSHEDLESVLLALDSGHISPPESADEVAELARRLGVSKKRKEAARRRFVAIRSRLTPEREAMLRSLLEVD